MEAWKIQKYFPCLNRNVPVKRLKGDPYEGIVFISWIELKFDLSFM